MLHKLFMSLDSLFSRAGLRHLGKGWIVCDTTTRRLPYWANGTGSSTRAGTGCIDLQLIGSIVTDCQALT